MERVEFLAANLYKVADYEVHVALNVTSINAISTVDHSFAADFFLVLHWEEPETNLRTIRQVAVWEFQGPSVDFLALS